MKQLFTFLLLVLMAVMLKPETAEASHMAGADLTYEAVPGQPLTFLVRLKLYRDCLGITLGTTANICYSSSSCAFSSSITAPEVAMNFVPSNACVSTAP